MVAYLMLDGDTVEREFSAYDHVSDNYPKYVVSMDPITLNRDGIIRLRLVDFLSDESLLSLG